MKVTVDIDYEGMAEQASAAPEVVASPEEVHEGLRDFYRQEGDTYRLDAAQRDEFVAYLRERVSNHATRAENARLRDQADRRMVADYVRECLRKIVRPEMLESAVKVFIADHKFGLRDGRVIVVGRRGTEEAELAAINWIADEGAPLARPAPAAEAPGSLAAEIASLRKLH